MNTSFLSRRRFSGSAVMAVATLALPGLRAQAPPEIQEVSISVGGKSALYYLPLTISEQLGYFKAEGLTVAIRDLAGQDSALAAVLSGAVNVGSGAFEDTLHPQARSQRLQSFVLQSRAPQIALGVSCKSLPHYPSIADLKGKIIGVPALRSPCHVMASLVLAGGGLKADEVRFVRVGQTLDALDALRSGHIDAMSHTDPVMTMLEQKNDIKIISDTRTLKGAVEVFGGLMPAACLYAPADFIEKNPNTCQALTNAMLHGLKWLQTAGPGDIITTVPERYLLGDRALYLASFNKLRESISFDGIMPSEGPGTALRALSHFDASLKVNRMDLAATYTNAFACRAKARFRRELV